MGTKMMSLKRNNYFLGKSLGNAQFGIVGASKYVLTIKNTPQQ